MSQANPDTIPAGAGRRAWRTDEKHDFHNASGATLSDGISHKSTCAVNVHTICL